MKVKKYKRELFVSDIQTPTASCPNYEVSIQIFQSDKLNQIALHKKDVLDLIKHLQAQYVKFPD